MGGMTTLQNPNNAPVLGGTLAQGTPATSTSTPTSLGAILSAISGGLPGTDSKKAPTPAPAVGSTAMPPASKPAPEPAVAPTPSSCCGKAAGGGVDHALRIAREVGGGLNHLHVPHLHKPKLRLPTAFKHARHMASTEHVGAIHSSVAGRTDHLPMHVPTGSYVIPADIVSGMGEGNTIAGFKHLHRMFGGTPYNATSQTPYGQGATPYGMAAGGKTDGVPIVAAGGEHVLTPEQVTEAGAGDLDRGHRVLDKWVVHMRKELIKTLKALPGPKKD